MSPVFAHGELRLYLLALLNDAPRHGYEVIRALEERFGGLYTPSAGTVYPRLARLEEEGLVVRENEGRKAVYRITEAGRAEVAGRRVEIADLESDLTRSVRRLAEDVRAQVRGGAEDLRAELAEAARQARQHAREEPSPSAEAWTRAGQAGRRAAHDVEQAVKTLRDDVRTALRNRPPDEPTLTEVLNVLSDAAKRVRTALEDRPPR
jgi:DNA-binding PadR family transcriptional regulator